MAATTFDLIQIQTDATDYAATFRTLIGAGTLNAAGIATGTITPRDDDINLSGGSIGDVITVQADGSLALSTPAGGAESPLTLTAGDAAETPLTIQGAASQTANLQEWQDSAGLVKASVGASGAFFSASTGRFGGLVYLHPSASNAYVTHNLINGNNAVLAGSQITLLASGSGVAISRTNKWVANSMLDIFCGTSTTKGQIIQGAASQAANLQEWQNSAGTVLSAVRADGSTKPAALADADAVNDSIYYSTDAGKLVYKDSAGTVNNLY